MDRTVRSRGGSGRVSRSHSGDPATTSIVRKMQVWIETPGAQCEGLHDGQR